MTKKKTKRRQVAVNWVRGSYSRIGRHRHTYCMPDGDIFIGISLYTLYRRNITARRRAPLGSSSMPTPVRMNKVFRVLGAVTLFATPRVEVSLWLDAFARVTGASRMIDAEIIAGSVSTDSGDTATSSSSSFFFVSALCSSFFLILCDSEYYPFWDPEGSHGVPIPRVEKAH